MLKQQNLSNIEELSYFLIIKENTYFLNHTFQKPLNKAVKTNFNDWDFKDIYLNKYNKCKKRILEFLKYIKLKLINSRNKEANIKSISILLLKKWGENFSFFFKFDIFIIFKIFTIIIYLILNEINIKLINEQMIYDKFKEKENYSQTEIILIIHKFISFWN